MIEPDKIINLEKGELVRICVNENCTEYTGYAMLVEPVDIPTTQIEGAEKKDDSDAVYLKQRWKVQYLSSHELPPFCTREEIFNQTFVENKIVARDFYKYVGTWSELKTQIIEKE